MSGCSSVYRYLIPLLIVLVGANCQLIDDFTHPTNNHLGGLRTGGSSSNPNELGFHLYHSGHFLMEPVGLPLEPKDLTGLAIKMNYTATNAGERQIVYIQNMPMSMQSTFSKSSFWIDAGEFKSITFSLRSYFQNANLLLGFAFKIGGPIIVHRLELVTDTETTDMLPKPLFHDLESKTSASLVYNPHKHYHLNINALGMKREGSKISQTGDGIQIADDGFINEFIHLDNLNSNSHIQIEYSSAASPMRIQIQYHYYGTNKYTQTFTTHVRVSSRTKQTVNVPISDFPSFPIQDDMISIYIMGPAVIHRISLLNTSIMSWYRSFFFGENNVPVLVDNLSAWFTQNSLDQISVDINIPHYVPINGLVTSLIMYPPNSSQNSINGCSTSSRHGRYVLHQNNFPRRHEYGYFDDDDWSTIARHARYVLGENNFPGRHEYGYFDDDDWSPSSRHGRYVRHQNNFPRRHEHGYFGDDDDYRRSKRARFMQDNNVDIALRLNNLNFASGTQIETTSRNENDGLLLNDGGLVFEQIAEHGHYINLQGMYIEITYSIQEPISAKLEILTMQLRTPYSTVFQNRIQITQLNFDIAMKGTLRHFIDRYMPAQCITITTRRRGLTIHQIHISIPIPGSNSNEFSSIVLNDYRQLSVPLSNIGHKVITPQQLLPGYVDSTRLVDYGQNQMYHAPSYLRVNFILGTGIDVMDDGWLKQDFHYGTCKYIRIRYSAQNCGTRKIDFVVWASVRLEQHTMHVMFDAGHYLDVFIPQNNGDTHHIISVHISGPLLVHQIELVDIQLQTPLPLAGQRLPDALLLDDFFDLSQGDTNACQYKRDIQGDLSYGFVTLRTHGHSLLELFRSNSCSLTLKDLAFRFIYTSEDPIACDLLLHFDESTQGSVPSHRISITLYPGKFATFQISMSEIESTIPDYPPIFHGIRIIRMGAVLNNGSPLIIHRVEMASNKPFAEPIQYHHPTMFLGETPDYHMKLKHMHSRLCLLKEDLDNYPLKVDRADIWTSALSLLNEPPSSLRRPLHISFQSSERVGPKHQSLEDGYDTGGLSREYFSLLASAINNKEHDLFVSSKDTGDKLEINPNFDMRLDSNLRYYRCIGRLIGIAIWNQHTMGIQFTPFIYKRLLAKLIAKPSTVLPDVKDYDNEDVDLTNLETIDPILYKHFKFILETNVTDLALYMCLDNRSGKEYQTVNLVKNGCQHKVTNENKNQYVREYANWHLNVKVEMQISALCDGLWEIVPVAYLQIFTENELEVVISGISNIDINDWRRHTKYDDYYHADHPVIVNFWKCVESFDQTQRAGLLQFATGSSRLPGTGFENLFDRPFKINLGYDDKLLPTSSTCINALHLPPYSSLEIMSQLLEIVTRPYVLGFGKG